MPLTLLLSLVQIGRRGCLYGQKIQNLCINVRLKHQDALKTSSATRERNKLIG